ncbi:MAG: M48 family metalloprotease, partial [Blastocatellia bacterium]|nr:M48 family metalloprotease [Blastocatellia bacterium]
LKFSRSAETEADLLGAQYLWAAGYDPTAMGTFFEKLLAQEKKKPGALAKVFSTHPMTGDRIQKVNALIARFPDRSDYTLNTSEFQQVKSRLISITNVRATGRGGVAAEAEKRPTLKRRQPGPDGGDSTSPTDQDQQKSTPPERPTLRRKDGGDSSSTKPPEQ